MYRFYERLHSKRLKWLLAGGALLIVVLLICVGVLLWKYSDVKKESQPSRQSTTQDVIAKVDKIYLLPKDDKPTVAQIKDKSKLSGNDQFYKHAQDGDYVLVYGKAKLALLYRESDNRLISVMPISLDQTPSKDGASIDSP